MYLLNLEAMAACRRGGSPFSQRAWLGTRLVCSACIWALTKLLWAKLGSGQGTSGRQLDWADSPLANGCGPALGELALPGWLRRG